MLPQIGKDSMPTRPLSIVVSGEQRVLQRITQLQVRCQLQREYLARDVRELQPILSSLDQCAEVMTVANQFSTPLKYGVLAGLAGLVLSRPKKALSLAATAVRYWSWWQRLSPLFNAVVSASRRSNLDAQNTAP